MDGLFSKTINMLSGMLDYRSKRHMVIASNVANMDTEGFKPSELTFRSELDRTKQARMAVTHPGHISPQKDNPTDATFEITTSDEKVSLDKEMANLAENNLMYNMTVEMLARKFRSINTVLKETK